MAYRAHDESGRFLVNCAPVDRMSFTRISPGRWPASSVWWARLLARVPAIVATVQLYVEFPLDLSIFVQQRLIVAGVGRYIAVSHEVAQRLIHKLRWPARKIQVIHNCVSART